VEENVVSPPHTRTYLVAVEAEVMDVSFMIRMDVGDSNDRFDRYPFCAAAPICSVQRVTRDGVSDEI
jgi:hypothetical protein